MKNVKVKRPRAPLPPKRGGAHRVKVRRPWRKRKHRGGEQD